MPFASWIEASRSEAVLTGVRSNHAVREVNPAPSDPAPITSAGSARDSRERNLSNQGG